jgi:acetyl-CoA carboxylase biotin carboxyl carrier protein
MALTDDDVREILRIIDESTLDELLIETDGFSLHVRKGPGAGDAAAPPAPTEAAAGARPPAPDPSPPADRPAPLAPEPAHPNDGLTTVSSPMLGTFYRAESPGAAPFVELGTQVEPDTTVCIIEVMKMMNSVPAGLSGVIAEVVADNAQLVEYGEPLFRIQPR